MGSDALGADTAGRLTVRLAQDADVPQPRRLVNAAYRVLGDMGLNYTGVTQDEEGSGGPLLHDIR